MVAFALGALAVILIQVISTQNIRGSHELFKSESDQSLAKVGDNNSSLLAVRVGQFREIFKHESTSDQYTALYTTLSHATVDELKEWWTKSQQIERKSNREAAQRVILREFAKNSPHEALRYIDDAAIFQTDVLLKIVFSEWAVAHLDGAIEAVPTLSVPRRDIALEAILESRDDLSENKRRSIALQLGKEETYLKLVSDTLASQSIAEPKNSWDILINDDVDDLLQLESLAKVAEAWRAEIGFAVLSRAFADGPNNGHQLIRAIAQVDLAGALDYAQGVADENEKQFLAQTIVRDWARNDALGAIAAVATFQPPSSASELESTVALAWASTSPFELIENIALISDRNRMFSLETAFSNIAGQDPTEAIALVSAVENYVGNTSSIIERIVFSWSYNDPSAAADWVVNNYAREDPQRRNLLEPALRRLARQDPKKAFEIAIGQPAPSERFGLEHIVMGVVTRDGDIELAKKLLPRVRESTKTYAYSLIGEAMVRESRAKEALELGEEVIENEKDRYYRTVMRVWASDDAKDLYASLEDLPIGNIQSRGASQLILQNLYSPILTHEQIARARTFLNEDDEAALKRIEDR